MCKGHHIKEAKTVKSSGDKHKPMGIMKKTIKRGSDVVLGMSSDGPDSISVF